MNDRWFLLWLLIAAMAVTLAMRWLDGGPPCYDDSQCDDLREIEMS